MRFFVGIEIVPLYTIMKIFSQLLLVSILTFGYSCSSSKQEVHQLQKEAPFKIKEATYQEWVAGVKGGGAGITISLFIADFDPSKIKIDSIYFRNHKEALSKRSENYVANIKTDLNNRKDVILHKNAQNEYGNQAPVAKKTIPFNLSNKEAVISFTENNRVKYIKILLTQIAPPLYE